LAVQQLTERGPTLGQWIEERWAPEHASTLAASTRERYAGCDAVHVAPTLDAVPLAEITVGRLRQWQAERVKAGVQPGSIAKARTLLSSILRHAAEGEAITANPMSLVRPPASERRDSVVPLAPVTVEQIRAALLDPPGREVAEAEQKAAEKAAAKES
jgi:site-specific recombinase XerD